MHTIEKENLRFTKMKRTPIQIAALDERVIFYVRFSFICDQFVRVYFGIMTDPIGVSKFIYYFLI